MSEQSNRQRTCLLISAIIATVVPWGTSSVHDRRTMLCREFNEERLNLTTAAAVGYS